MGWWAGRVARFVSGWVRGWVGWLMGEWIGGWVGGCVGGLVWWYWMLEVAWRDQVIADRDSRIDALQKERDALLMKVGIERGKNEAAKEMLEQRRW